MCSININDPLPTIEYKQELFEIMKIPEYTLPMRGDVVTLVNLDYEMMVKTEIGEIMVAISYINGIVLFTIPSRVRPFCFVKLPSIDKYCFYDIKNSKPIGRILEEEPAMKAAVSITLKAGKTPSPSLLAKAGMYVPGSKTPPSIPVLPIRTKATRTIQKQPNINVVLKSKPVINNLDALSKK